MGGDTSELKSYSVFNMADILGYHVNVIGQLCGTFLVESYTLTDF